MIPVGAGGLAQRCRGLLIEHVRYHAFASLYQNTFRKIIRLSLHRSMFTAPLGSTLEKILVNRNIFFSPSPRTLLALSVCIRPHVALGCS